MKWSGSSGQETETEKEMEGKRPSYMESRRLLSPEKIRPLMEPRKFLSPCFFCAGGGERGVGSMREKSCKYVSTMSEDPLLPAAT